MHPAGATRLQNGWQLSKLRDSLTVNMLFLPGVMLGHALTTAVGSAQQAFRCDCHEAYRGIVSESEEEGQSRGVRKPARDLMWLVSEVTTLQIVGETMWAAASALFDAAPGCI